MASTGFRDHALTNQIAEFRSTALYNIENCGSEIESMSDWEEDCSPPRSSSTQFTLPQDSIGEICSVTHHNMYVDHYV